MQSILRGLPSLFVPVVVVTRWRMLRSGLVSLSLWIAMTFLALALAIGIPAVYDLFGTSVRGHLTANPIKLWMVIGAGVGVQVHNDAVARRAHDRIALGMTAATTTAATVTIPLLLLPPGRLNPILQQTHSVTFFDSTWRHLVLWLPYLAYFTWILVDGGTFSWRQSNQAQGGPTRTALRLASVGLWLAFSSILEKLTLLPIWFAGTQPPTWSESTAPLRAAQYSSRQPCSLSPRAGSLSPTIKRRAHTAFWSWPSTRRLRPLWAAIVSCRPELALPTDRRYRLRRTVVEIRDGLLALADDTEQSDFDAARGLAKERGATDPDAGALATIVRDYRPAQHAATLPAVFPVGGSGDLRTEVDWLTQVAREYQALRAQPSTASFPSPPVRSAS